MDDFTLSAQFLKFCQALPNPKEYQIIEEANHFWWGYESTIAARTVAFFTKVLKQY